MKRVPKSMNASVPRGKPPQVSAAIRLQIELHRQGERRKRRNQLLVLGIGALGIAGAWLVLRAPKSALSAPEVVNTLIPEPPAVVSVEEEKDAPSQLEQMLAAAAANTAANSAANPTLTPAVPATEAKDEPSGPAAKVAVNDEPSAPTNSNAAALLSKEETLVLIGKDAGREMNTGRDKKLLLRALSDHLWDAYRGLLSKSIQVELAKLSLPEGRNRFDGVWKEPSLYQSLLRWKVLGRFSESELVEVAQDLYSGEMLVWMLMDNHAMEQMLLTIKPEDDGGKVLKFLRDAWAVKKDQNKQYFNLALACAVVFDHDIAITTPDKGGKYEIESKVDSLKRYQWYIEKNEKGKLAAAVDRMDARDLVWVVCAPISNSEMDWAISKMSLRQKNWGDAYGMIEYLMERAVKGLNPYKEYTFAEILKEGGVCGDQSYFCCNTARANGIPAMTMGGETDLGGHAWVAMKIQDHEWTTGIGRIGGVSKGQADNPQIGGAISEQEVQLWSDREHQSDLVVMSVFRHLWLADFYASHDQNEQVAETVKLANLLGHAFTETWGRLHRELEKKTEQASDPADAGLVALWKEFVAGMRHEFKENPRMSELAAKAESEHIFPYGEENDAKRSMARERRRIDRNSGEQKDLIATSLKREADLIMKRNDENSKRDVSRLYETAIRAYGGGVTGFKMMSEDYFNFFQDDKEQGRKVVRDIELAFKRVIETGTKEWFRANTEIGIYRTICGYYRVVGDAGRAEMLEKRMDRLLEQAERGAL
jgi:hypothetical protein